jgi:hypothetical protein
MFVILDARRRLQASPANAGARWVFVLTTLAVPVLGFGAFEGFYNHVIKDLLFFHGASVELMVRLFPPPTYEMPNNVFFEATGVAQVIPAAAAVWYLVRFVKKGESSHRRFRAPTLLAPRILRTITDQPVPIPDGERLVHLQFRRFAGCPVCTLHLHSFVRRQAEVLAANVREVVIFHSTASDLGRHAADLPFAVIPDPARRLYAEFGVGESPRAVLDPRAWGAIFRGVSRSLLASLPTKAPLPPARPEGGGFGLPADFLVASDGRVVASKYGEHADDQWSVDELLGHARAAQIPRQGTS